MGNSILFYIDCCEKSIEIIVDTKRLSASESSDESKRRLQCGSVQFDVFGNRMFFFYGNHADPVAHYVRYALGNKFVVVSFIIDFIVFEVDVRMCEFLAKAWYKLFRFKSSRYHDLLLFPVEFCDFLGVDAVVESDGNW